MNNDWRETEKKVFAFFKEHPVHGFKPETIANYLNLTENEVREALEHLLALDIIDIRFQYQTERLVELIDDMTKEK